jgi:carnitine O-acetyltransferase
LAVLQFKHFGKDTIRKEFHLSPDSFIQNAIQLAYYRRHGCHRATYESAQTRKFYRGRTETVRSCTNESRKFVSMMMMTPPTATTTPTTTYSIQEKYEALKAAIIRHTGLMNEAVNGQGIDRHLLGLNLLLQHDANESAALFDDPAYSFTNHWFLSTSQVSSEYFENKGWGEVVLDGFGIGYMIKHHSLHFNVTSRHLGSHDMCRHIEESLLELANVCREGIISSRL